MAKNKTLVIIAAYLLAAAWFFFPLGKPEGDSVLFAMRLALPATLLAAGSVCVLPRLMTLAFFFCAIGDAMGVLDSFVGQMGSFALAHLCFISHFIRGFRKSGSHWAATMLCLIPLVIASIKVIPAVHDLPLRIGCIIYALLLCGTLWTTLVRALADKGHRRILPFTAALGAMLFLVSDFILSWNKFTSHVNHASLYIMTTYYLALLFLFVGTIQPIITESERQTT